MDNNILASKELSTIVDDLLALGYGRNDYTDTSPRKKRVIDFNQGLDARLLTEDRMKLLAKLHVRPMRIAFDKLSERHDYVRAIQLAHRFGVPEFSNYMLYNFQDTPRDLYERLAINIQLNEGWSRKDPSRKGGKIYSYPMRYAPITDTNGVQENRSRDLIRADPREGRDWLREPAWTGRFVRNVEVMKGAAHGTISPVPSFAWRAIGRTFEEFVVNLYMPEEILRNRSRHERRRYKDEPARLPGTGKLEAFRVFLLRLLQQQDERFWTFHLAVSANRIEAIREAHDRTTDRELRKWLELYLGPRD
jgi:hypothetical protein